MTDTPLFRKLAKASPLPSGTNNCFILRPVDWNDWWEYSTKFELSVVSGEIEKQIGAVKIGEKGLQPADNRDGPYATPNLPDEFDTLDNRFFSVGQSEDYYENLSTFKGPDLKHKVLTGLRDMSYNLELLREVSSEYVLERSLLRSVHRSFVTSRLHDLAHGRATLTEFDFQYTSPETDESYTPYSLEFSVSPRSTPPTNIHILIGRNGVGKTHCLQSMAESIVTPNKTQASTIIKSSNTFSGVVSVSFSAFDPFAPITASDVASGVNYTYIGLKQRHDKSESHADDKGRPHVKVHIDSKYILESFEKAVTACVWGARRVRWRDALNLLSSDPVFSDTGMAELAASTEHTSVASKATATFERLSSGHKLVLLIITRLVEVTQERTLVLLDEPEAHLHPPLVGSFVRCLSQLLIDRNGVAIVATHSPVVLQEVPKSCVYKIARHGTIIDVSRPEIETFGESVSRLTSDVFGHEVTQSGFHQLLKEAAGNHETYEAALASFGGALGVNAKAMLRTFIAGKKGPSHD